MVNLSEFEKVLVPFSPFFPLSGLKTCLVILRLSGDEYRKIYALDVSSQSFSLRFDPGQNITGLFRDPTRKQFYYLLDGHGDENHQIYRFDSDLNSGQKLFGHDGYAAKPMGFSAEGKLYVMSNHAQKDTYSFYIVDPLSGEARLLSKAGVNYDDAVVSPNGRYLALMQAIGNTEQQLEVFDLESNRSFFKLARAETVYNPAFFSADSKVLYLTTDHESERQGCALVAIEGPHDLTWFRRDDKKDIFCSYSWRDNYSDVVESFDGRTSSTLYDGFFSRPLDTGLDGKSSLDTVELDPEKTSFVFSSASSRNPGAVYLLDRAGGEKTRRTILSLNRSVLSTDDFADSYDLYSASSDGVKIHSIYFAKPEWLTSGEKRPVIVWPHGGPSSHETHRYNPLFQFWVMQGYIVLAPNFRGSTGYGKKFVTAIYRDWGGKHLTDVLAARDELKKLSFVHPENQFICGGSFGGYSTLAMLTTHPKEFRAGVALLAIANLFTFMESIPKDPAWQAEFTKQMGHPVADPDLYRERSPYFFPERIQIPLKIYQAENDVRTVKSEMDNFVARLKEADIPVEYEVLLNEGHGISRSETWEKVLQGTIDFFNRYKVT